MYSHDAHYVIILTCRVGFTVIYLIFLLYVYISHEMKKSFIACLFICHSHFYEHIYVLSALFAGRHGRGIAVKACFIKYHIQKLMDWCICNCSAQPSINLIKSSKLFILIVLFACHCLKCRLCKALPRIKCLNLCKLLIIEPDNRGGKHCCHRNILQWIVQYTKHRQNHLYFIRREISCI